MSDLCDDTISELTNPIRACEFQHCASVISARLRSIPDSPYHAATSAQIASDPHEFAVYCDEFLAQTAIGADPGAATSELERLLAAASEPLSLAAAYVEMNGFDVNTDRWFCNVFGFTQHDGHEDYDWLSDWDADRNDDFTIVGMESLQAVYAANDGKQEFCDARELASLFVVVLFQEFVNKSAQQMQNLSFPLLATAHGYDFISESKRLTK